MKCNPQVRGPSCLAPPPGARPITPAKVSRGRNQIQRVAALAGSIGIAQTANLNPGRQFPSMFEPIHGSAFDIAGQGIANTIRTFWTVCMMLDHLGEADASTRLMRAIEQVTADQNYHAPDLGGQARTTDMTVAVIEAFSRPEAVQEQEPVTTAPV